MRSLRGTIVSSKMSKTVVVRVDRLKKHPKYLKYYRISRRFKVHVDNEKEYSFGDVVVMEETRPFSKEKRWKVVKLIKRSEVENLEESE